MILKKILGDIDGGDVLDVGCGSGQFTDILIKSLNSFDSITGVDIDEEFLKEASRKFPGKKFRFLHIVSMQFPFNDESFDLVAISKALHHVEDPGFTLREMKRVLRSGGYLLINEMHRDQLTDTQESHMLYHHLRSEIDNILGISHNHTFRREDLIRLGNGLELEDRVIMEYSPDSSKAKDPANIEEFSGKLDHWMQWLDGHPEKAEFALRIDSLKDRFRKYGISRPPQLIILGKKP